MPQNKTIKILDENKNKYLKIRISQNRKNSWKRICKERKISLTELITSSVENKKTIAEKREILEALRKEDYSLSKIANNINQFTKVINAKKTTSDYEISRFNELIEKFYTLKTEQENIMLKIYKYLSNDC